MNRPKMRFYNSLPERHLTTILNHFTRPYGELRPAVESGKVVKVVVATSKYGRILGWCAVYHSIRDIAPIYGQDYSLGIFVSEQHRHRGIGGKLRRKAILWCLRQRKKVWWFRDGYKEMLATREAMAYIDAKRVEPPKLGWWSIIEGAE